MKRPSIRVTLGALFAAVLMALAVAVPAFAEDYQYTVRVFPGNRGTLSADPVTVSVPKGGSVDLYSIATATITDGKYVQTGFRQSGTDTLLGNGVINGISEDMDYVVAYGVEANTVAYTLQYVEYGTGKQLAEPRTFYGKAGDKPVAAYEYIEGYRPRYLAITGTLKAGEENVWTFEYIPLAEGETVVTTTTNTTTTVQTTEAGATTTETGTGTATTAGGTAATPDVEGGAAGAGTEGGTEAGAEAEPETQEILDLDTPLAGPGSGNSASTIAEKGANLLTNPFAIAGVAIALAGCAGLCLFFVNRKKKEEKNEEEA